MNRQLKQAACPYPPPVSSRDRRIELQGSMTAPHPRPELAGRGCHATGYCARRCNRNEDDVHIHGT